MLKIKRWIKKYVLVGALACSILLTAPGFLVNAAGSSSSSSEYAVANDQQRAGIKAKLQNKYDFLLYSNTVSDENKAKMENVYKRAINFLSKVAGTQDQLEGFEHEFEVQLETLATKNKDYSNLMLSNEVPVSTAKYGKETFVILSLINIGESNMRNVVITPKISTSRKEWPFEIQQATDAKSIPVIPASYSMEEAYNNRMDIGWTFKVREDVLTGVYPLTFNAIYYNEDGSTGKDTITTYINIIGKDPKKSLEEQLDVEGNISKPRVIVTGYTTTPSEVYAGSVFQLKIKVQNTSSDTSIENVLFDLKANVESGSGQGTESYAAFLPTSGSSSIYTKQIAAGEIYEIEIEMEAKADLSQKPYVLNVTADYFYGDGETGSGVAQVSIPVKQEAKMDTGSVEVLPESINVGSQSNVMFSIFNTGKTTLYNVKVNYESESVDSGITYIGNLTPGNTGNVDSMVTGVAANDGQITAVITYEDESGKETRVEKEISLLVNEEYFDDFSGMDDFAGDMPETFTEDEAGIGVLGIVIIVVVVLIVVAIIVFIVIKKKKNKKREQLDLLDEDDL